MLSLYWLERTSTVLITACSRLEIWRAGSLHFTVMPEVLRRRPRTASLSGVDIAKMRADTFEAEVGEGDDLVTAAGVVVAVLPGIATAGLDSQNPEVGVLPGDGDLDTKDGEGAVSADIHIETDCFQAEDAGVGGNHPEAEGFTGVLNSHKQSGYPHVHTKLCRGGIGNFFFLLFSSKF